MRARSWKVVLLVVVVVVVVAAVVAVPVAFAASDGLGAGSAWAGWQSCLSGWWQAVVQGSSESGAVDEGSEVPNGSDPTAAEGEPVELPGGEAGPWGSPDGLSGEGDGSLAQ